MDETSIRVKARCQRPVCWNWGTNAPPVRLSPACILGHKLCQLALLFERTMITINDGDEHCPTGSGQIWFALPAACVHGGARVIGESNR